MADRRPRETGRSHWAALLAVAVLLASAWVVGTRGMADALAEAAPSRALGWYPGNPEALARINEGETDPARKAQRARQILARQPLDGRAYRQLAEVADGAGDHARALALYAIAASHSPRDRLSRAWLADHAYAQGDPGAALRHVDALLRMDASLREPLFERLALLCSAAPFREALAALLRSGPDWSAQFIAWLDARRAERVEHLLREQRWDEARRTWADGSDRNAPGRGEGIVNGGFEQDPHGAFDWHLENGIRQGTAITPDVDGNRVVRVELFGPGVQVGRIAQLLLLAPGTHVVSLRARLEGLRAERGLVAEVFCADEAAALLGRSEELRGSSPWHVVSFEAVVPAACPAQWLRIDLASQALDRNATGVAWFDDFSVRPAAGAVAAPVVASAQPSRAAAVAGAPAPDHAGFHDAVANALAGMDDRMDRDAPFGP